MKRFVSSCLYLAVMALAMPSLAYQKVSANYILRNDALTNGTGAASSASFKLTGFIGRPDAEASSSALFVSKGFVWYASLIPQIRLALTGNGSGSVNSDPSGIACSNGICTSIFTQGGKVTLIEAPGSDSVFSGWSGACANTAGNCVINLNGAQSVAATFSLAPPIKLLGTVPSYYSVLQSACDAAVNGSTIQGRSLTFSEQLIFNRPIVVRIEGGYDSGFTSASGLTKINAANCWCVRVPCGWMG